MIAQAQEQTQVSPETNLTIADHCTDPSFQQLLRTIHTDQWESGERQEKSAVEISKAILRMLCGVESDDEVSGRHPEVRALFAHLERERVKVADMDGD